ncbi:MAG: adenine-specific methyltransferase EcoRI family protein [Candidatus Cryptobacteroides sp.]
MANNRLNKAKSAKKDEFYTQLSDIENELRHYRPHFKDKTVLCNCDDPRVSNFFKYFALNFEILGLKKLIATCYKNNEPDLFSMNQTEQAVYIIYDGNKNRNKYPDPTEMEVLPLQGDGDFRSEECIELLKQADIVCTNPPFSLLREYISQLLLYDKRFIIIGNQNVLHYSEIFPYIKNNKIWLGYGFKGGATHFISKYEDVATAGVHKEGMIRVSGVIWLTNLEIQKRHEELILYKTYNPSDYPKYDNYDAINVNRTQDIPVDYYGDIGVPDTFLDKYNPDQFEIVGLGCGDLAKQIGVGKNYRGRTDVAYTVDGKHICPYSRIIIRRKI